MKFIHVADIHASRERLSQILSILNTLTERAKQLDIDFIVFAGDFWDSTITATKGSGFSDIISAIRKLEYYTPLYFIYGTPSHEPNGSLDAFKSPRTQIIDKMCVVSNKACHIACIPEPRRSDYIANSMQKTNELINSTIDKWINETKEWRSTQIEYLPILDSYEYDKPLVVVYHGEVKGAVYQNGMSASSPTAISKEQLESLKADYYALGHIHLPQEVFPNAWYSGSACPKNFGEEHVGCYNLVTSTGFGKVEVERISFNLPTYTTLKVFFGDFAATKADFSNIHLRLKFDCTKEQKKSLNIREVSETIKEKTHALSVKLEPNVIEGEEVTKSEVIKHKTIVKKLDEYVKEKSLKLPKYTRELLQDIQDNTLIKLAYPQHSFELLSLSLRGAIGIYNGQHKDDYELNFEDFEDGVICLCGECGKGKSTILENCHPYPQMLSRKGTLKEHFRLKDSHRIIVYKDENETYYRISMLIDAKTANGKVVYLVETSKDRAVWHSLPEVDGSLKSYEDWVNGTFGSIDVFLRTAFFAKEQTKDAVDISDTSKGERMELLSKLAGTEHLKEVSVIARELRKVVKTNVDTLSKEIESYSRYENLIKECEDNIDNWSNELAKTDSEISNIEKELSELKQKDAEYQKVKALSEANAKLKESYENELTSKKEQYDLFDKLVTNHIIYEQIETSQKVIADNALEIESYSAKLEKLQREFSEMKDKLSELEKEEFRHSSRISTLKVNEKHLTKEIGDVNEVCPTCGAPLSKDKKEELQKHIDETKAELKKVVDELKDEEAAYRKVIKEIASKDKTEQYTNDIAICNQKLKDLYKESDACEKYLKEVSKSFFDYSYDDAVEEHMKLTTEIEGLGKKIEEINNSTSVEDVSDKLSRTEKNYQDTFTKKSELSASIKSAEKEIERYQKELDSVKEKKAELKELSDKILAYDFIEDAFSNNGIPAIELKESAPEIAEIANKILEDSYGNKFEIRFGSTSELKANRKTNEDFNIIVFDTENGDEKTIDLVSSGERIWLKQALFYAFSIVQMNRTGFNFRTRLIDESDGSLDGGLRPKYLKMVTAAHKLADSRLTMLITHSQEIKDIAEQIIEI